MIAAANVNAFDGDAPGVAFLSMSGFVNPPTRASAGVYDLTLSSPPPNNDQTIPIVTPLGSSQREVVAAVLGNGHIQINMYDTGGVPVDNPFFIVVHTAPVFP